MLNPLIYELSTLDSSYFHATDAGLYNVRSVRIISVFEMASFEKQKLYDDDDEKLDFLLIERESSRFYFQ